MVPGERTALVELRCLAVITVRQVTHDVVRVDRPERSRSPVFIEFSPEYLISIDVSLHSVYKGV